LDKVHECFEVRVTFLGRHEEFRVGLLNIAQIVDVEL
jgi:hypothetical protein